MPPIPGTTQTNPSYGAVPTTSTAPVASPSNPPSGFNYDPKQGAFVQAPNPTPNTPNPVTITPQGQPVTDQTLYSRLPGTPVPALTQATQDSLKMQQDQLTSLQSAIDGINEDFNQRVATYKNSTGAQVEKGAADVSSLMGLGGSSSAEAKAGVATTKVNTGVATINKQRGTALADAQKQISLAETAYNKSATAADTNQATLQQGTATDALSKIADLLPGVTYAQFKKSAPSTYQSLLNIMGGNDAGLELLWNNQMKAAKAPTASDFKVMNGTIYQFDPTTGDMTPRPDLAPSLPSNPNATQNSKPWSPDGGKTWYTIPIDSKGQMQFPSDGNLSPYKMNVTGKTTAPPKLTTTEQKAQANTVMSDALKAAAGADGYVSPTDWATAQQDWINHTGGTAAQFTTSFGKYMNPKQPSWAPYLVK